MLRRKRASLSIVEAGGRADGLRSAGLSADLAAGSVYKVGAYG